MHSQPSYYLIAVPLFARVCILQLHCIALFWHNIILLEDRIYLSGGVSYLKCSRAEESIPRNVKEEHKSTGFKNCYDGVKGREV